LFFFSRSGRRFYATIDIFFLFPPADNNITVTLHVRANGRLCNDGFCNGGTCISQNVDSPDVIASEIFNWAITHWCGPL
jgi:hypothetical protein